MKRDYNFYEKEYYLEREILFADINKQPIKKNNIKNKVMEF